MKLEHSQSLSGEEDMGSETSSYQLTSGALSTSPSRVEDENNQYASSSVGMDESSTQLHLQQSTPIPSGNRPGLPQINTSVPANNLAPRTSFSSLSGDSAILNNATTPGINSPFTPGSFHHPYATNSLLGPRYMSTEHRNSYPGVGMEYLTSQPLSVQVSPHARCHSHDGSPGTPPYNTRSHPPMMAPRHSFTSIPSAPDYSLQNQFSDEGIGAEELNVANLHQARQQQQLHEQMMQKQQQQQQEQQRRQEQQQQQAPDPPPEIQAIQDDYNFPQGNFQPPMEVGIIMPSGALQYQPTLDIGILNDYKEDAFDGQSLPGAYFGS